MGSKVSATYNLSFQKAPLITLAALTSVRMMLGDTICQQIERTQNPQKRFDFNRTRIFGLHGLLVNGPFLYTVYTHVYPRFPSSAVGTVQKMLLSQTFVSFMSIVLFYTFVPLFKGGSLRDS